MTGPGYDALIRELFPRLTGGIRWGLERTERMLAAVGDPHLSYRTVHIGGTNGKGSVSAMLAAMLRAGGHRTGLYSSPHLCSFRERVMIDGAPVAEDALVHAAGVLWPHIQAESPSFFEATTAIGLLALAEAGVEVAVIEVGLGGRLDATNVIRPEVAVVTNVALDHERFLGTTIASVAREKAGIFKPGTAAVSGALDPVAERVLSEVAAATGAPLTRLPSDALSDVRTGLDGTSFTLLLEDGPIRLRTGLIGTFQARNAALAVVAGRLLPGALRPEPAAERVGLEAVRWPGRLQVERVGPVRWVFDVAHNPAGVAALVETLAQLPLDQPRVALIGVLGDKDWRSMLGPVVDVCDVVILTQPPTAPVERCWDPEEAARTLDAERRRRVTVANDFTAALEDAQRAAGQGTVLVTGSFHTVGDALIALRRTPAGADVALPHPAFAT